jgi:hypothetical protein
MTGLLITCPLVFVFQVPYIQYFLHYLCASFPRILKLKLDYFLLERLTAAFLEGGLIDAIKLRIYDHFAFMGLFSGR